ncbi:TadE/TadG family type IV pilus assembly protein [Novosphingobium bradum]|uniref:TadE/TadG family type IV pilus assembly protein n=1 Tax=Novosphingobium bradum TaxID=1737444 RepID=A0ABV7IRE8_9SPHN
MIRLPFAAIGRLRRDTGGLAAVEFALVASALIGLLVGAIDYSLWSLSRTIVERAARGGSEYAAANGYSSAAIATAITSATSAPAFLSTISASPAPTSWCGCQSSGTSITAATCNSTCANGQKAATYVTASASATYTPIMTWPGVPATVAVSQSNTVRIK